MNELPVRIKSKNNPGLVWRPKDLSKNIEDSKNNVKLSPAMKVASNALEKHVLNFFRDFGAGDLADQEKKLKEQGYEEIPGSPISQSRP